MIKAKVRLVAAQMTTGGSVIDVPFTDGDFSDTLNGVGSISCTVPMYSAEAKVLQLGVTTAPSRTFLGVTVNDRFAQLGPIWKHAYSQDGKRLRITASSALSYWNFRALLGPESDIVSLLTAEGKPNPATDFRVSGLDLGTIAKRAVQRANDRPEQGLPMVYENDRVGTSERNLLGSDLKSVGSFLGNISGVINGPDIKFEGEWNDAHDGVQVRMRTGTAAEPRLYQAAVHRFDTSVAERSTRHLEVEVDGQDMADMAWTVGGRNDDKAVISRRYNPGLKARGYPRLDYVDGSHNDAVLIGTLNDYGDETLRRGSTPRSFWSFEVRSDLSPFFGEFQVGDYCNVIVKDDPYIPDGTYLRRIVQISGNFKGKWIKVVTGETEWNNG